MAPDEITIPAKGDLSLAAWFFGAEPVRHDWVLKSLARGLLDVGRDMFGLEPLRIAVVGPPGSASAVTTPGAAERYITLAGPGWNNSVCARFLWSGALFRPVRSVARLRCPVLFQIGTNDQVVSRDAIERAASLAGDRATVVRYPLDHFDVFEGAGLEQVLGDQVRFLEEHLASKDRRGRLASDSTAGP